MKSSGVRGVQRVGAKDGWQVTHAGKYLGFFKNLEDAIACKAAKLNITPRELQKRQSQHKPARDEAPRKYKNIIRVANGWQAHKWENGKLIYLGCASTDVEAADIVAKHTGCMIESISHTSSIWLSLLSCLAFPFPTG